MTFAGFVRDVCRKVPPVRSIVRTAGQDDGRFSAFVLGIVNSAPFRMRVAGQGAQTHEEAK